MEVISINVGFIGAGKVGFSLGKYFVENGISVSGYFSRSKDSAKEASVFTGTGHFENIDDLVAKSDIIFITTPDDEIYKLWTSIRELNIREKIICHTSGSLSSNIFSSIEKSDAYAYSIHPIFPIANKYESYKALKNACFTIEGHSRYMDDLILLFKSFGNTIIHINREDKALYHLASVAVSNLFCALLNRATAYLDDYGFSEKEAIEALYQLILSNINNIKEQGFLKALTGPVERNDLNTIKKHIAAMPQNHRSVYKDLSLELLQVAEEKNKDRDYSQMKIFLEEGI